MSRLKVALLYGGRSGEHEVSLRSGAAVGAALLATHDVLPVFIDKGGRFWLKPSFDAPPGTEVFLAPFPGDRGRLRRFPQGDVLAEPDVYFPVLHGPYGEDGTIQGLLELAGAAYAGAGVAASAAGMDKALMKSLFGHAGIPQTRWRSLRVSERERAEEALAELGLPLFVKPANLGSSVGVSKVKAAHELGAALDAAFAYDRKLLLEAAVEGRELEVSVLGNDHAEASLPGEIVPDREFYDYDSKYSAESRTVLSIPAALDAALAGEARRLALLAFRAVDACGYARVDLFLERTSGRLLVNEINTIPGFTSISMFPKLWEASGLPYAELVARLVVLGLERHAERLRLRSERANHPN